MARLWRDWHDYGAIGTIMARLARKWHLWWGWNLPSTSSWLPAVTTASIGRLVYNPHEKTDYLLYSGETPGDAFLMRPGWFCAVMPEDAHMPGVRVVESVPVKKAVFKIAAG